jgi:hypothetical protein
VYGESEGKIFPDKVQICYDLFILKLRLKFRKMKVTLLGL